MPKGDPAARTAGTGKTLLAKAVANEANAKFFAQSASSFVEMFAGLGAARIRRLSARRARQRPRSSSSTSSTPSGPRAARTSRARRTRRSTSCSSRWTASPARDELVVIAASNLLEKLDPALLRPGPLRPPDLRLAARSQGPQGDPQGALAQQAARPTSTSSSSRARRAASPAPTSRTSATRPRSSPAATAAT